MMKKRTVAVASGAVLALAMTACSSGNSGTPKDSAGAGSSAANAAVGKVFQPSTTKGGTLRFGMPGDWDSVDPGDTYYGLSWNFLRNYARTLTVFKAGPGAPTVVPDLATTLGKPSDGAKTWTYTLRDGLKYEDGTAITAADVKYGVARQLDKDTFVNGPTYFNDFLKDVPKGYSVYKDKNLDNLKSIETPDAKTIVFHLKSAFSGFDYFAQLPATAPVPAAKDKGSKYKQHVVSSGPYMFDTVSLGKKYTLKRNPNYDPKTDPESGRLALPNNITVELGLNAPDVDNRLLAGDLDVDINGTGVQAATQGKILGNAALKAKTDSAAQSRTWFQVLNVDVPPLNNVDCRKAVILAADKNGLQRAFGGATGGDIATSLMPPVVPGHKAIDLYQAKSKPTGDVTAAKAALAKCGQPNGFETNIAYRAERPKEKATAESLQQSLNKVGIKLTIKPYPVADYAKLYAGKPDFAKKNKLGVIVYGWGADWPDGFGFLSQIVDSRVIREAGGNTNLGIKIPAADKEIDKALATVDTKARNAIWGNVDQIVMENAAVLPGVWAKGLLYRPDNVTNVFVNTALGQYDYAAMGTSKK
jgi:peptide/nickel transport system substrate-binding protein